MLYYVASLFTSEQLLHKYDGTLQTSCFGNVTTVSTIRFVFKTNSSSFMSDNFSFSSNKQPFVLKFRFTVNCISVVFVIMLNKNLDWIFYTCLQYV